MQHGHVELFAALYSRSQLVKGVREAEVIERRLSLITNVHTILTQTYAPPFFRLDLAISMGGGGV